MDKTFLKELGIKTKNAGTLIGDKYVKSEAYLSSFSPVDGQSIGQVSVTTKDQYEQVVKASKETFKIWRKWPAPNRGETVRLFGEILRKNKDALGRLVSYEMGKSLQEGWGEVQEMIDICDFAVGLSRQLYGLTMHSERPDHRMYEQWHPLGITGIISAFNFPVAVWSWNAMIALVSGDVCIWKPSEKAPLCSVACQQLLNQAIQQSNAPAAISSVINGDYTVGAYLTHDPRIPLISATGSIRMGKIVGQIVSARLGRSILELGGNNAIIVTPNADVNIVLTGALFGAIGTAGQRCTSTRRLIVHSSIYEEVKTKLQHAYAQVSIGNPLEPENHMGPLIDQTAVKVYLDAIKSIKEEGGKMIVEGGALSGPGYDSGCYVSPSIAEVKNHFAIVQTETFAPLLYLIKYENLEEAIAMQNNVPQGLSSAIMTDSIREAELFLSCEGSDCGIANVNIGTSGAEIGGAFGGEKETGGGRESGSDAWKAYMRRQTNTINFGKEIPLAQGISFDF
jgi:aldehyde dehydrogenase (NAD+)